MKRLLTVSVARMRENGNAVAPAANGQPKVDCVPFNSAEVVRRSLCVQGHALRPSSQSKTYKRMRVPSVLHNPLGPTLILQSDFADSGGSIKVSSLGARRTAVVAASLKPGSGAAHGHVSTPSIPYKSPQKTRIQHMIIFLNR